MRLIEKLSLISKSFKKINTVKLVAEALDLELKDLYKLEILTNEQLNLVDKALSGYMKGIPLSRIFQRKYFYRSSFIISPYTFEPRPETEMLIEYVHKNIKPENILDIGTGSGAILLSILQLFPTAKGVGTDLSPYCIKNASQNANILGLADRAKFLLTNLTDNVNEEFDLVISNPPYVITEVDEATQFDPPLALYDKGAYESIIKQSRLKKGGFLVLEVPNYKNLTPLFKNANLTIIKEQEIGEGIMMIVSRKV